MEEQGLSLGSPEHRDLKLFLISLEGGELHNQG